MSRPPRHCIAPCRAPAGFAFVLTGGFRYHIHMKRTNLVLDEELLNEARRLSGERTYSAVVNLALRDLVRRIRARRILELAGSGLWQGDLSRVRGDRNRSHHR
jgi:Arc/MetJ family transcription regulator